jgi:chaperonin GroES
MAKTAKLAFTPIEDRVLIEPMSAETTSASGIVLPDSAQEKPNRGTIVAAGPGSCQKDGSRSDMSVAIGDEVIYGPYSGTKVELNGTEYMILRASEILAKIA